MKQEQIITSRLDRDVYKENMASAMLHFYPGLTAQYGYNCRNPNIDLRPIRSQIVEQISVLDTLVTTKEESAFLKERTTVSAERIEMLETKPLDTSILNIYENDSVNGKLKIITEDKSPILDASELELPVMYIISELYAKHMYGDDYEKAINMAKAEFVKKCEFIKQNAAKILILYPQYIFKFVEFGTRRRISRAYQEWAIQTMYNELQDIAGVLFMGTSNMKFAMDNDTDPRGSMAHEWIMLHQSIVGIEDSQRVALERWYEFFKGKNDIALTDTLGIDKWEKDFTADLAEKFKGERHDSNCPYIWGSNRIIDLTLKNIDITGRKFMFSDSLTFQNAMNLSFTFGSDIDVLNGIGTHITNDIKGMKSHMVNQIFKALYVDGKPVAKLSDDTGKGQCPCPIHMKNVKSIAYGK